MWIAYNIGFTSEFAKNKTNRIRSNRTNITMDIEVKTSIVKSRKLHITSGRYNNRDTTVTNNNVMVSFLSLLAAPWC